MRHGLSAWVAEALEREGRVVPAEVAKVARAQVAQALALKRLTGLVCDALAARGIVPVLLKGYGLATRLFPEQPLSRPSSDVDIWVSPDEMEATEEVLRGLHLSKATIPGIRDEWTEHHHRAWVGTLGLVEVHFRLFSGWGADGFDDAAIRARTWSSTLDGRAVRFLCPEDECVYLAVHAANHGFLRLSWLYDVSIFIERHPQLDWAAMARQAQAAGHFVAVAATLQVVTEIFQRPLSAIARTAFALGPIRQRLLPRLLSPGRVRDSVWSTHRLGNFLLRLAMVDSAGQGARHLLEGSLRALRQVRHR